MFIPLVASSRFMLVMVIVKQAAVAEAEIAGWWLAACLARIK